VGRFNKNNKYAIKNQARFICTWPREMHTIIKLHANMQQITINEWVLNAIESKFGKDNTITSAREKYINNLEAISNCDVSDENDDL